MTKQNYIEELFKSMGQLRKLLESHAQESHEERAATLMQFSALKFLKYTKRCTVGDLAEHLRLSKSSATQLIERLEKAHFVDRIHDQTDRRIVHVTITPAGEQQFIDMKKKFLNKMEKIFSNVPDDDLKELVRIHTSLIETLRKEQQT